MAKHTWRRDEDGEIDIWAMGCGYHNGPMCTECSEYFCHHCDPDCYDEDCEGE